MKNLAGVVTCDKDIVRELEEAGITIVGHPDPDHTEVPAAIAGKLGEFSFIRAWYYWIVVGEVPLEVAEIMYSDPIGRKDVRVRGDAGRPAPRERTEWRDPIKHREILDMKQKAEIEDLAHSESNYMKEVGEKALKDYDFAEDPSLVGEGFISSYHIDSQAGLNLFVRTLKEHKLV